MSKTNTKCFECAEEFYLEEYKTHGECPRCGIRFSIIIGRGRQTMYIEDDEYDKLEKYL